MGLGLQRGKVAVELHDPRWEVMAEETVDQIEGNFYYGKGKGGE